MRELRLAIKETKTETPKWKTNERHWRNNQTKEETPKNAFDFCVLRMGERDCLKQVMFMFYWLTINWCASSCLLRSFFCPFFWLIYEAIDGIKVTVAPLLLHFVKTIESNWFGFSSVPYECACRWIGPHVINLVRADVGKGERECEGERERNHLTIHHISYSCVFDTLDEMNEWTERTRIQAPNQSHSWRTSNTHVVKSIHRSVNVFRRFPSHSFSCLSSHCRGKCGDGDELCFCGDIFRFWEHIVSCGDLPIYSLVSRRARHSSHPINVSINIFPNSGCSSP